MSNGCSTSRVTSKWACTNVPQPSRVGSEQSLDKLSAVGRKAMGDEAAAAVNLVLRAASQEPEARCSAQGLRVHLRHPWIHSKGIKGVRDHCLGARFVLRDLTDSTCGSVMLLQVVPGTTCAFHTGTCGNFPWVWRVRHKSRLETSIAAR